MASRRLPTLVAAAVIAAVIAWLTSQSVTGFLTFDDEHYTAERSREMMLLGPWAVQDNFQPTPVKPPLQYWLNAIALTRISNPLLALRFWPLIFAALTGATVCWLAHVVDPTRRWLAPFSVAFLFTCALFLRNVRSATLDSGLIFFATIFITAAQLAREQPRWWMLAAVACWLGALQKAPVILFLWLVIVSIRAIRREQSLLRERWLWSSLLGAVLLMCVWPLAQHVWFHLSLVDLLRLREPFAVATRRAGMSFFDAPYRLTTTWTAGGLAIAACAFLPAIDHSTARSRYIELSGVCVLAIALSLASNTREVNYLGPIIPLLCLILARGICAFAPRRGGIPLSILVGALALAGLPLTHVWMNRTRNQQRKNGLTKVFADHAAVARALRQRADGRPLFIIDADSHMLVEEFYLFYGQLPSRLTNTTVEEIPSFALIGISLASDFEKISGARAVARAGDVVCWSRP